MSKSEKKAQEKRNRVVIIIFALIVFLILWNDYEVEERRKLLLSGAFISMIAYFWNKNPQKK